MTGIAEKLARKSVRELVPYSSARNEGGVETLTGLDANESPYEPFPCDGSAAGFNRYPDPQPPELIDAMASFYGVGSKNILATRGADEAIDVLLRAFCESGKDAVVFSSPTFDMYEVTARIQGAKPVDVPLVHDGFRLDVEGIKKACDENANVKMVFVCSPNNPTANSFDRGKVLALCEYLAGRALVVVDEAYIEFSRKKSVADEIVNYPNLVVLRTLSKAFALAGIRMGALIAAEDVREMAGKVLGTYPLPVPCVKAAVRALSPAGILWMKDKVKILLSERERVIKALERHDDVVKIYPSDANFLLLRVKDSKTFMSKCAKAGFLIRDRSKLVKNTVRLSIGSPEQNTLLLRGLGLDSGDERKERTATVSRKTKETDISVTVNLDRCDILDIDTGIGFFDHMLEQLGKHGKIGLVVHCKGDTHIDDHHSVEDCAIALGEALRKALGNKRGINRYGFVVPMDESQASVVLDLSGRAALRFEADFPTEKVGEFSTEMVEHFFKSLCDSLGANIHVKVTGDNSHHMIEGLFKALARALHQAMSINGDDLPSTKGLL